MPTSIFVTYFNVEIGAQEKKKISFQINNIQFVQRKMGAEMGFCNKDVSYGLQKSQSLFSKPVIIVLGVGSNLEISQ